jgi:predicted PolB exonuclease-like 3'-5' exonuclease
MRGRDVVVFDIETVVDGALARDGDLRDPQTGEARFPAPPLHRVVAIAFAQFRRGDDGGVEFVTARAGGAADADERQLLAGFWRAMTDLQPTFVGYNSRGFDFPVLLFRSMRHGVEAPLYFSATSKWDGYRQRYATDWHLDVADALTEYGASRRISLDLAARTIGAPGKLDVDGGDVAALFETGRIEEIRGYCVTDVLSTALVWLAWLRLQGAMTTAQLAATHAGMRAWLEAEGAAQPHLRRFADAWPMPSITD